MIWLIVKLGDKWGIEGYHFNIHTLSGWRIQVESGPTISNFYKKR